MTATRRDSTLASNLRRMLPVWTLLFVTVFGSLLLIRAKGRDYLRDGIHAQQDVCQVAEFHYFEGVRLWRTLADEVAGGIDATRAESSMGRLAGDERLEKARLALEQALRLCPSLLTGSHIYLADLAWWNGEMAMTHYHLGREHLANREWVGARAELETAFTIDPQEPRIAMALIELVMIEQRYDRLEEFLAEVPDAVRLSPTGQWGEATLAANRGDLDAAADALRAALAGEPGHTGMVRDLARVHHQRGDFVEGADWLMTNLDDAVGVDAASYHQVLLLYAAADRFDKALEPCDRALAIQRNNVLLLAERALILHRLGRTQEARATVQQAISVNANAFLDVLQDLRFADVDAMRGS